MSSPILNNPARLAALGLLCATALATGACSLTSRKAPPQPAHPVVTAAAPAPKSTPAAAIPAATSPAAAGAATPAPATTAGVPAAVHQDVPPAARADFTRAVNLMRAGNAADAERAFRQIATQYPQFAAPLVNIGLMQRKQGQLDKAEESLKSAVAREGTSAVAWTELGVTQRMRGEFKDAAASYQKAVEVDPLYAPAWRNLGVLEDLYLADPARALPAFEQYKTLTGEEKPVSGWIADLRQRLGMPAVKRPEAAAPAPEQGAPAPGDAGAAPPPAPQPAPGAAPKTGG
jgi:tetratricopeptide (TPR) repeat protein